MLWFPGFNMSMNRSPAAHGQYARRGSFCRLTRKGKQFEYGEAGEKNKGYYGDAFI